MDAIADDSAVTADIRAQKITHDKIPRRLGPVDREAVKRAGRVNVLRNIRGEMPLRMARAAKPLHLVRLAVVFVVAIDAADLSAVATSVWATQATPADTHVDEPGTTDLESVSLGSPG